MFFHFRPLTPTPTDETVTPVEGSDPVVRDLTFSERCDTLRNGGLGLRADDWDDTVAPIHLVAHSDGFALHGDPYAVQALLHSERRRSV